MKNANNQTFTDVDGKYSIEIPEGLRTLEFSKREFRVQEVEITGNVMNIVLTALSDVKDIFELSLEELMQMEVYSATRTNQRINEAPATIMVITRETIKNRGYGTLNDVLRDLPGVDLQRLNGWYGTFFSQRGLMGDENKRTIVMVNGIVDNQLWGNEVFVGYNLPLHNVERIEIIWGPVSSLYGANAFNGIINVVTETTNNKNFTQVNIGGGSFETSFANFQFAKKLTEDLRLSVAGNIFDTKGPTFEHNYDPDFSNAYVDKAYAFDVQLHYRKAEFFVRHFRQPQGLGNSSAAPYKYLYDIRKNRTFPDSLKTFGSGNSISSDIFGDAGMRFPISGTTIAFKEEFKTISNLSINFSAYFRNTNIDADH